jgi:ferredoxin
MPIKLPSLVRPSTRAFIKEARKAPGFSLPDFLHGYIYGRWPFFYIAMGTGQHPLSKKLKPLAVRLLQFIANHKPGAASAVQEQGAGWAHTYHGKVLPLEAAKELVQIQEEIALPDLEHIIPYDRARALILHNPQHIIALDCPCRVAKPNPCTPIDVCLVIGEPFASFIIEHQPNRARWITSDEAVDILKAEDERGHVHHAFFKDAMLGRFYAICNCCACCCGAMQAQAAGTPMLASSGYLATVAPDLCLSCGTCVDSCQFDALSHQGPQPVQVDPARCMGCGVCVNQCPTAALSLQRAPHKGAPLEIISLLMQASK